MKIELKIERSYSTEEKDYQKALGALSNFLKRKISENHPDNYASVSTTKHLLNEKKASGQKHLPGPHG